MGDVDISYLHHVCGRLSEVASGSAGTKRKLVFYRTERERERDYN